MLSVLSRHTVLCTHTHTKHTVTSLQPTHNQQRYSILMGNRLKLQIRLLLCLLLQTGTILADSCTSSNTCRTCRECSGVSKRFCEYPLSLAIILHILYFSINHGKVTFTDFETVLHYYIGQSFLAMFRSDLGLLQAYNNQNTDQNTSDFSTIYSVCITVFSLRYRLLRVSDFKEYTVFSISVHILYIFYT